MSNYAEQLKAVEKAGLIIEARRFRLIEKAMKSDNPSDMIAANAVLSKMQHKPIQDPKAFLIDPLQFNANLGFKDKPFTLTYTTLQRMAKTPIINAIIKTRKNQIADFAEPQADRYNTGFIIRKKVNGDENGEYKMTKQEQKIANAITDFILNCGKEASWTNDDFDTFIRKIVDDSLTYDQMTFECIRNRKGQLESFIATDASTFRVADTAFEEDYKSQFFHQRGVTVYDSPNKGKEINGYLPQYVQVYQSAVVNDFYPWELCFGIRNPSSSIYSNGYGCSELEELINVVTSMLWGDEYNRRFFSQGSAPKGFIRVKGGMNEAALQQFKQQWQAMINGVMNAWRTPVVEADVDWIDLQKNNRDMEYTSWMEYLIKLACAIFSIDPTEIGWDISRSNGNSGLFESSEADRLQHSKDKGLYPILKFLQRKINKYIVEQINPEYEFVFMGLNGMTIDKELEMDIKKLGNFMTVNEVRSKWGLPDMEVAGDIIENSVFWQAYNQTKQQEQQQEQGGMGGSPFDQYEDEGGEEVEEPGFDFEDAENPYDQYEDTDEDEDDEDETEKAHSGHSEGVFAKAFENYLRQEENNIK